MKKLFTIIVLAAIALPSFAQSDVKRVAILETVDKLGNVPYMKLLMFRSNLTTAITNTEGYEGYDRVDLKEILGEQNFQRTGLVSEKEIKKIGEFTGAQYVLIAEATIDGNDMFITAKIIDVETARVLRNSNQLMGTSATEMQDGSQKVARTLLVTSSIGKNGRSQNEIASKNNDSFKDNLAPNRDYIEEAFGINMKMIWVEGGEFMMGCTSEQGDACSDDEKNIRRVKVDGFYIGMLEVTQAQFEKVMEGIKSVENPSMFTDPERPVERVCYRDAIWFCRRLSNITGKNYLLPTEAQWEYAARGGVKNEKTMYAGSNQIDAVAWYKDNAQFTSPCGTKMPNALGIYDMSGNVFEWCRDWYSYKCYDTNNPTGPSEGTERVIRGGSIFNSAGGCRITNRASRTPDYSKPDVGFRVVCIP